MIDEGMKYTPRLRGGGRAAARFTAAAEALAVELRLGGRPTIRGKVLEVRLGKQTHIYTASSKANIVALLERARALTADG